MPVACSRALLLAIAQRSHQRCTRRVSCTPAPAASACAAPAAAGAAGAAAAALRPTAACHHRLTLSAPLGARSGIYRPSCSCPEQATACRRRAWPCYCPCSLAAFRRGAAATARDIRSVRTARLRAWPRRWSLTEAADTCRRRPAAFHLSCTCCLDARHPVHKPIMPPAHRPDAMHARPLCQPGRQLLGQPRTRAVGRAPTLPSPWPASAARQQQHHRHSSSRLRCGQQRRVAVSAATAAAAGTAAAAARGASAVTDARTPSEAGGFDVIVIGAGIGGLCCSALLAMYGLKVWWKLLPQQQEQEVAVGCGRGGCSGCSRGRCADLLPPPPPLLLLLHRGGGV